MLAALHKQWFCCVSRSADLNVQSATLHIQLLGIIPIELFFDKLIFTVCIQFTLLSRLVFINAVNKQVGPDAFEQAASGGGPGGPFGAGFGNPFEDIFGMNDVCGLISLTSIFSMPLYSLL